MGHEDQYRGTYFPALPHLRIIDRASAGISSGCSSLQSPRARWLASCLQSGKRPFVGSRVLQGEVFLGCGVAKLSRQEPDITVSSKRRVHQGEVARRKSESGQLRTKRLCLPSSFVRNVGKETPLSDRNEGQSPPLILVVPPTTCVRLRGAQTHLCVLSEAGLSSEENPWCAYSTGR